MCSDYHLQEPLVDSKPLLPGIYCLLPLLEVSSQSCAPCQLPLSNAGLLGPFPAILPTSFHHSQQQLALDDSKTDPKQKVYRDTETLLNSPNSQFLSKYLMSTDCILSTENPTDFLL